MPGHLHKHPVESRAFPGPPLQVALRSRSGKSVSTVL